MKDILYVLFICCIVVCFGIGVIAIEWTFFGNFSELPWWKVIGIVGFNIVFIDNQTKQFLKDK